MFVMLCYDCKAFIFYQVLRVGLKHVILKTEALNLKRLVCFLLCSAWFREGFRVLVSGFRIYRVLGSWFQD